MKTLVIHPEDSTTAFLSSIYRDKDWHVVDRFKSRSHKDDTIRAHDRIIMLGHGSEDGLWVNDGGLIISSDTVQFLREKLCVAIWCNADIFFTKYKLKGIYTGMIISEQEEASLYGIKADKEQIRWSNICFANTMAGYIDGTFSLEEVLTEYHDESNPVIQFNKERIFETKSIV